MKKNGAKDYFSTQANVYATFRPTYPETLYQFILQHLGKRHNAWDCGTGNGQVAAYLADHFENVYATDISQRQLDNAVRKSNIFYSLEGAEKTVIPDHSIDLITVGQAFHWFDRDAFYREVERVAQPEALLAVWGYSFLQIEPAIDKVIMNFYQNTVGPYWDDARRLVEEEYRSIAFPFEEIVAPKFFIKAEWTPAHLSGYLESWSATQKYMATIGSNPVVILMEEITRIWHPETTKEVRFPVFLKLFKVNKT